MHNSFQCLGRFERTHAPSTHVMRYVRIFRHNSYSDILIFVVNPWSEKPLSCEIWELTCCCCWYLFKHIAWFFCLRWLRNIACTYVRIYRTVTRFGDPTDLLVRMMFYFSLTSDRTRSPAVVPVAWAGIAAARGAWWRPHWKALGPWWRLPAARSRWQQGARWNGDRWRSHRPRRSECFPRRTRRRSGKGGEHASRSSYTDSRVYLLAN